MKINLWGFNLTLSKSPLDVDDSKVGVFVEENLDQEAYRDQRETMVSCVKQAYTQQLRKRIREQLNGWFLHRRPSHGKSLGADGGINYVMRPEKAKWFLKHYSFTTEEWYEIQESMSAEEQIDYLINKFNIKR